MDAVDTITRKCGDIVVALMLDFCGPVDNRQLMSLLMRAAIGGVQVGIDEHVDIIARI